jgi:hypothetical protein
MRLTDTSVRNAKSKVTDYRLTDGHGLHLFVKTNGRKLWRWRYEFQGKEKLMSFGSYPDVSLKAAREAHESAWKRLADGIDPMADKKEKEQQSRAQSVGAVGAGSQSFRELANDWFAWWSPGKNDRYADFVQLRMERDILPPLGGFEAGEITPQQICDMVIAVEKRGAEDVARRVLQTTDLPLGDPERSCEAESGWRIQAQRHS